MQSTGSDSLEVTSMAAIVMDDILNKVCQALIWVKWMQLLRRSHLIWQIMMRNQIHNTINALRESQYLVQQTNKQDSKHCAGRKAAELKLSKWAQMTKFTRLAQSRPAKKKQIEKGRNGEWCYQNHAFDKELRPMFAGKETKDDLVSSLVWDG